MSGNIRLYNTNGYVELQAPSSATNQTLVLPTDSIQPGLVHLHTETFSAVSSVSIDNVFSTEYDNYLLSLRTTATSVTSLRLRANGTDNSSALYNQQSWEFYISTVAASRSLAQTSAKVTEGSGNGSSYNITISSPRLAIPTMIMSIGQMNPEYSNVYNYATGFNNNAQFDGFTLLQSGTTTGTLRIYGYRNA